jgi:hypothetical protein
VAAHGANISSASIPAVSFVIAAVIPARCHKKEIADCGGQSEIKGIAIHPQALLQVIRNYNKERRA